jgi:hypothetical protein
LRWLPRIVEGHHRFIESSHPVQTPRQRRRRSRSDVVALSACERSGPQDGFCFNQSPVFNPREAEAHCRVASDRRIGGGISRLLKAENGSIDPASIERQIAEPERRPRRFV